MPNILNGSESGPRIGIGMRMCCQQPLQMSDLVAAIRRLLRVKLPVAARPTRRTDEVDDIPAARHDVEAIYGFHARARTSALCVRSAPLGSSAANGEGSLLGAWQRGNP